MKACTAKEHAAGEITLPFSYTATVSDAPRPAGLHFDEEVNPDNSQVFVRIEDELWQFRCPWIIGQSMIWRYHGKDIDHMVRDEVDGKYPEGLTMCWFLGGMWYDEEEKKLYAPVHIELPGLYRTGAVDGWFSRKILLATSTDKGETWHYEGSIIDPDTYYYQHDGYKFSGVNTSNGLCDFGFFADVKGGYFYIFGEEGWYPKGVFGANWNVHAARCKMSDKMAPGKWQAFYNGAWDEPALGGKSSAVAPSHLWSVIYCEDLDRYIGICMSNSDPVRPEDIDGTYIGTCTSLEKQDWQFVYAPDLMFGFNNVVNGEGTEVWRCKNAFRNYCYAAYNSYQRTDIEIGPGETTGVTMTSRYTFNRCREADDPIIGRKTRIIGTGDPAIVYSEKWIEETGERYYLKKAMRCDEQGESVSLTFRGGSVFWRALVSPDSGKADIFIDGEYRKTADLYNPNSRIYLRFGYYNTSLDPTAVHTIQIVVRGEHNKASTGCSVTHIAFEYGCESYRPSLDFTSVNGKNNWYYCELDGEKKLPLKFPVHEYELLNYWQGAGSCMLGDTWQVPYKRPVARIWRAPHDGDVTITGTATINTPAGTGLRVSIRRAGVTIWSNPQLVVKRLPVYGVKPCPPGYFDDNFSHYNLRLEHIKTGEEIAFVAQRLEGRSDTDRVSWDPEIIYDVPGEAEPIFNEPSPLDLAENKYAISATLFGMFRPFDAVDGCPDTSFTVEENDNMSVGSEFLMVDLDKEYTISHCEVVFGDTDKIAPVKRFSFWYSADKKRWTCLGERAENVETFVSLDFAPVRARYVKLFFPNGKPLSVERFSVYNF